MAIRVWDEEPTFRVHEREEPRRDRVTVKSMYHIPGPAGADGKSAYEVWLSEGNEGTEDDFFRSLQGPKGDTGKSAYESWLSQGNEGSETEFVESLQKDGTAPDLLTAYMLERG